MNITNCSLCNSNELLFAGDITCSALANNLTKNETESEKSIRLPLGLAICQECEHVQLSFAVDNKILFDQYFYESGVSTSLRNHFDKLANLLSTSCESVSNPRVLDIGSNDGVLLDSLAHRGFITYGVEPAKNLVEKTKTNHTIINGYFNTLLINETKGLSEFDVITANNVFAHTRNLGDFATAVSKILRTKGLFVFEVQYLVTLIKDGLFDMVYHEHTSYHHLKPLVKILPRYGLYVIDAELITTHGGSIRVFCSKHKTPLISGRAQKILDEEEEFFNNSINKRIYQFTDASRSKLQDIDRLLLKLAGAGKRIIGYSAPAKATTLISGLSLQASNLIEFVVDDAPLKVGKYIPGTKIKIVDNRHLIDIFKLRDDYNCSGFVCIIFAWNIGEDLIEKIRGLLPQGLKIQFLLPLPSPVLL